MRLFVYGTLKRNFCRHHVIQAETFLGETRTAPLYRMFNIGTYPGLVEAAGDGVSIQGEIWEVSDSALVRLDEVESVDQGEYARRRIQLESEEFDPVEAYFYLWPMSGCPDCGEVWDVVEG